jgi:hypothetical protein
MNIEHPIYDYEIQMAKDFQRFQHNWILKSRGLGVTEIVLRYFGFLCLTSDYYANKTIHIITGTKLHFANKLLIRLINILKRNYPDVNFYHKHGELILNKTLIEAYPTKALKDLRGHIDVSYIFIDEADFFDMSEQAELPYVIKSYEEKSNAKVIMVSTPNRPDGLFHSIEEGSMFRGFFKQHKLGYEVGLDKIYSRKFIEREKLEPEFEREYNLKYLGKIGNVFSTQQIEECIRLGELYNLDDYPDNPYYNAHWGGVDYGYNFSKTTIYVGELFDLRPFGIDTNIVRLIEGLEYDKSDPRTVGEKMHEISRKYPPKNLQWFVDGSDRGSVNLVKQMFGENINWESSKDIPKDDRVQPVSFHAEHIPMLKHYYVIVSNGQLAIPKSMGKLITAMRTAVATDFDLDKNNTVNNDHIDAVRLLLKGDISLDDTRK